MLSVDAGDRDVPLIGNKVIEAEIRQELTAMGYPGRSAMIPDVSLVAIERPGWVQLFEFRVRFPGETPEEFFGLCRDDERDRVDLRLFLTAKERAALFQEWSRDLITLHREPRHVVATGLLLFFAVIFGGLLLARLMVQLELM